MGKSIKITSQGQMLLLRLDRVVRELWKLRVTQCLVSTGERWLGDGHDCMRMVTVEFLEIFFFAVATDNLMVGFEMIENLSSANLPVKFRKGRARSII